MSKPGVLSSSDLLEKARSLGYEELPEVVESLKTGAERGHHLALVAGEGSGADLLFGVAVALRCEPGAQQVQALVVSGTRESVVRNARAVQAVTGPSGVGTRVWEEGVAGPFQVVCGRPPELLVGVRSGRLGLGGLRLLVLDGLQDFDAAGAWPAAESILDTLEPDTQRIACTADDDARFRSLLDRSLPRARSWPPELFPSAGEERDTSSRGARRVVWTIAGETEAARLDRLVTVLRQPPDEGRGDVAVVRCTDEAEARRVSDALAVRGLGRADEPGQPGVFVGRGAAPAVKSDVGALFGLPLDLTAAREWLEGARCMLACVSPRHVPQLSIMLRRLGWSSREAGWPLPPEAGDAIEDYRSRIRAHAEEADETSQLSLLAPLLEELGPLRLLAALSELVRQRDTQAPAVKGTPEAADRPAWTPVFLNVGQKDGAGPGDIVGAITGETPAVAAQIGKIDVRASHTIVELDSLVADQVIAALHGSRIKGRNVSARPDRAAHSKTSGRARGKSRGRGG